jgi:uncharacterized protein YyaL (SSP411 family)
VTLEHHARTCWSEEGRWWASLGGDGLPVRIRSHHDGAVPSGLSAIIDLQVRLALATRDRPGGRDALEALARTIQAESGTIMANPVGLTWAVAALARAMREGLLLGSMGSHATERPMSGASRRIVCTATGCSVEWA